MTSAAMTLGPVGGGAAAGTGRRGAGEPAEVRRIVRRTPEATAVPLIQHRPESGLQGKFSLEYAAAAALPDDYPGSGGFTGTAARGAAAGRLTVLVGTKPAPGGHWLPDGEQETERDQPWMS